MQALLKKEYLVNRQQIIIDLILMIILSPLMGILGNMLYFGIILSCFQPVSSEVNEKGIDSDIFINSLPITRKKIVFSKYLYSIIIGTVYLSIVFVISTFITASEAITIKELMVGLAIISLYLSAYFPVKYIIRQGFYVFSFLGYYAILAGLAYSIYNQGESFDFWGMYSLYTTLSTSQVVIISIVFSLTVLAVSFRYSSKLYKNADLK